MSVISNNSFQCPIIATDPVTKGTFKIEWAMMLLDYDEYDEEFNNSRATGSVLIEGFNNPLYDVIKECPLRVQGLVSSAIFGVEKKFIRFSQISDYGIEDDGIVKEISFTAVFDILDNLEYLEKVQTYRDDNLL